MSRIYIHTSLGELEERVGGVEVLPEEYGGSIPISTMTWYFFQVFWKAGLYWLDKKQ